jgi:hypothetical protein
MLLSPTLPHESWANLVGVESYEIIMIRPHRTNAPDQKSSLIKRNINQKDLA